MERTYVVTERGLLGEPLEIRCVAHPECPWRMQSTGPKADNNPVFMAQFANHMEVEKVPPAAAISHLRRARR